MKVKFSWNREIKCLLVSLVGILLLGTLVCHWVIDRYCGALNREYNLAVAAMLDSVREAYPNTSEERLIAVLNRKTDRGEGRLLLGQYGVLLEETESSFTGMEENIGHLRKELAFLGITVGIAVFFCLFLYLMNRQREIAKLCGYMDELSRGNFSLDVSDNREDELSGLKNELYKLTVLLREQAIRAVENKRALADAVADISHQLKTPLTSVTVLVDNLLENEEMDSVIRSRFLREISTQLSGVNWLVATLLKLSRLDAGVVELERKKVSLRVLAEELYRKLEIFAEWRQVTLKLQIPEEIFIWGDAQWLMEAFVNLVKNAVEHSIEGGQVELSAEENEVYTLVTVRDYGRALIRRSKSISLNGFIVGSLPEQIVWESVWHFLRKLLSDRAATLLWNPARAGEL